MTGVIPARATRAAEGPSTSMAAPITSTNQINEYLEHVVYYSDDLATLPKYQIFRTYCHFM